VATSFPARTTDGSTNATHLIYGTAHHFHDDAVPAYWSGPNNVNELTVPTSPRLLQVATWEPIRLKNDFGLALLITLLLNLYVPTT